LHIDVYQFAPTAARPCWTLITGGMSDFRQPALEDPPPGIAPRAELLMYAKQVQGWMPTLLKGLAEMPFERATCLHWAHTVPNGQPITQGTNELTSFFLCPPICETEKFEDFSLDGDRVAFLMVVPITDAERVYAVEHGSAALGKLMEDSRFDFVVDVKRMSLV
jgi:Suppressor of fused protein (SUFU)